LARYEIKTGHLGYRNYAPESLDAAQRALSKAVEVAPEHANAYVLFGHLYMLM